MKKQILTIALLITASMIFAQGPISNRQTQINAGVGLSSWGVPVYFGIDFGVHPDITLGGELSFRSYNDNWSNRKYNHSIIGVLGNVNYHSHNRSISGLSQSSPNYLIYKHQKS